MIETNRPRRRRPRAPADRNYLLERVGEAAVVQVYADAFGDLAAARRRRWSGTSYAGRDRRPRHLLRPALRPQPRDARRPRGRSSRILPASTATTLDEIDALHQAVLDQHRPVQQPDRAQVRARRARRTRSPPRHTLPQRAGAAVPAAAPARRSTQLLARLEPMFFDPDVDPTVTSKTPPRGQGHPHRQRQQPVRRRDDEGSRGFAGAAIR